MHGPPATQPAQQNGRPTWNTGSDRISPWQLAHVNGVGLGDIVGLVLRVVGASRGGETRRAPSGP